MKIKLGEALRYEQPTKYIVASEKYNDSYATPVLTAGKSFILGYTNEESGIYDNLPVIIFDDFTTDIKYVDFPFKVKSSAMKMLQPANENYNLKFFYYLIKYMNFQPTSHQRHWISKFAEMEFDIPERVKQDQIVEKLDKLVEMQSKKTTQLKKYDDLVKSQFIEMFGDPDLSQQKESWDELENVGEIVGGSTPKTSIKEYWDGDLNWFTPAEIKENDFIVNQSERKITELGAKSCSLRKMPINTVILSSRAPIGKVALAGCEFYCNQGFKNIVCNENLNPIFLLMLLKYNNEYLNSLGRGATFKEISKTIVSKIKIPTPPIELQNQFADFVKHIDKLKFTLKEEIKKLQECYNSLMKEYFE